MMRQGLRIFLFLCAGLTVLATAGTARAENDLNSQFTAWVLGELSRTAPVSVRGGRDTEVDNRLVEVFVRELEARGFTVADQAPQDLRFETSVSENARQPRDLVEMEIRGGSSIGSRMETTLHVPLLEGPIGSAGRREYRLDVTIYGDLTPVWQGRLVAWLLGGDRNQAFEAMVVPVVDELAAVAVD